MVILEVVRICLSNIYVLGGRKQIIPIAIFFLLHSLFQSISICLYGFRFCYVVLADPIMQHCIQADTLTRYIQCFK